MNIKYGFTFKATVKDGIVGTDEPSVAATANPVFYSATVTTGTFNESFDFTQTISKQVTVPSEIAAIESLKIVDNATGNAAAANISLAVAGSPVGTINLNNVEITVPSFLDIETPAGWTLAAGKLKKSTVALANGMTTPIVSLPIKGLKNLNIAAGKISLNESIAIKGSASVASGTDITIKSDAQNITITPTITLGSLRITEVTGRIDADLSSYITPQEINLSGITSALGDAQVDLNLVSPSISMVIKNPIGVPINATIRLTPYKNATAQTPITTGTIAIAGAASATPAETKLFITGDAAAVKEGYTKVLVTNLANIINTLPDKLKVEVTMDEDATKPHWLMVQNSYAFEIAYSVDAGLKFGAGNGSIVYNKVLDNIDLADIAEVKAVADALTLNIAADSTLPLDVEIGVAFLDADGNPVAGITTLATGKVEGTTDGTVKKSTSSVAVTLTDGNLALLGNVKKVRCSFSAATLSGGGLKPDQYLCAALSLRLDNGVTVDLESLK